MGDNFEIWKQHFIKQARGLIPHEKVFYKVSEQTGRGKEENIKMVSPTEQVVERAKSNLSNPPVVYDPVTGITNQPIYKKKNNVRKRKQKGKISKIKKPKKPSKKKQSSKKGKKSSKANMKKKKTWYDK